MTSRITLVWLGLVLATCLSWEAVQDLGWMGDTRAAAAVVLAVAFAKTRFILLDFMELRHAPLPARLFAEGWWLTIGLAVIAMYWTNGGPF